MASLRTGLLPQFSMCIATPSAVRDAAQIHIFILELAGICVSSLNQPSRAAGSGHHYTRLQGLKRCPCMRCAARCVTALLFDGLCCKMPRVSVRVTCPAPEPGIICAARPDRVHWAGMTWRRTVVRAMPRSRRVVEPAAPAEVPRGAAGCATGPPGGVERLVAPPLPVSSYEVQRMRDAERAMDASFVGRLRELETMLHQARAAQSPPPPAGRPTPLAEEELCGRIQRLEAEADQLCLSSIVDVHMLRRLVGCVGGNTLPGQLKPFVHSAYVLHDREGVSQHTYKQYEIRDITGMDAWIQREWVWVDGLILAKVVSRTMFTSIRKAISAVPGAFDGGRLADGRAMVAAFQRDLRQIVSKVAQHGDKSVRDQLEGARRHLHREWELQSLSARPLSAPEQTVMQRLKTSVELQRNRMHGDVLSVLLHVARWELEAARGARDARQAAAGHAAPSKRAVGAMLGRRPSAPSSGSDAVLQPARLQPQQPRWVMVYELRPLAPLAASPQFVRNTRDALAQHGGWAHLRPPSDWGSSAGAPAHRPGVWWSKPSLDPATGRCVESVQEGVFLGEEDHVRLQQTARRRRA